MKRFPFYTFKTTICLFYVYLKSCTAETHDIGLDLNDALAVFESCAVHIILAQLVDRKSKAASLYQLVAPISPTITSVVQYVASRRGPMQCNSMHRYSLLSNGFIWEARYHPKLNCLAEIYVDPPQCQNWTLTQNPFKAVSTAESCTILPQSFKLIRVPKFMAYDSTRGVSVTKHYWFLVHVRLPLSSFSLFAGYNETILMDCLSDTGNDLYSTSSLKIILVLQYDEMQNSRKVQTSFTGSIQETTQQLFNSMLICPTVQSETDGDFEISSVYDCLSSVVVTYVGMQLQQFLLERKTEMLNVWKLNAKPPSSLPVHIFSTESKELVPGSVSLRMLTILVNNVTTSADPNSNTENRFTPLLAIYSKPDEGYVEKPFQNHFLSCTKLRHVPQYSLLGFVSAFDSYTWTCLLTLSLLTSTISRLARKGLKGLWCQVTFCYNILLCQASSHFASWKLLFLWWIMAGVLLSNQYQGENITRFVSQLDPKPLSALQDILAHNFTFLYFPLEVVWNMYRLYSDDPEAISTLHEIHMETFDLKYPLEAEHVLQICNIVLASKICQGLQRSVERPINLQEYLNWNMNSVANRFSKCNETAIIGGYDQLAEMYSHLESSQEFVTELNLHISKKSIYDVKLLWVFKYIPWSATYFEMRLGVMWQSGILPMLSRRNSFNLSNPVAGAMRRYKAKRENVGSQHKSLSLSSNVFVVFLVWLVCILVSVAGFTLEDTITLSRYIGCLWGTLITSFNQRTALCLKTRRGRRNKVDEIKCGKEHKMFSKR